MFFGKTDLGLVKVPDLNYKKICQVSCGDNHIGLMLENDDVILFGNNKLKQCEINNFD